MWNTCKYLKHARFRVNVNFFFRCLQSEQIYLDFCTYIQHWHCYSWDDADVFRAFSINAARLHRGLPGICGLLLEGAHFNFSDYWPGFPVTHWCRTVVVSHCRLCSILQYVTVFYVNTDMLYVSHVNPMLDSFLFLSFSPVCRCVSICIDNKVGWWLYTQECLNRRIAVISLCFFASVASGCMRRLSKCHEFGIRCHEVWRMIHNQDTDTHARHTHIHSVLPLGA